MNRAKKVVFNIEETQKENKVIRVKTLYRVSTKKQVNISENHQNDIPLQKEACHEFVNQKPGWMIVEEYEEKGISGYKVSAKKRDAILELQDSAIKGEFDVLLVFMFDRIGRIDDETPFIVEWFVKKAGIQVWSVQEGQQCFDSHVDKLMNYIRFWQASGESEKTSIRVKSRMHQLKLMGIYTGGPKPYGYRLVPSSVMNRKGKEMMRFEIDLEQFVIVRKIVERTINEGVGSTVMARLLNEQGYLTNNQKEFTSKAILRILSSNLLRGITNEGDTSEPLQKLKVIQDDEVERIDYILEQRGKIDDEKRRLARQIQSQVLLSGNIFCAHCGGRIGARHHKDKYVKKDGTVVVNDTMKYYCYHKANKWVQCDAQTNYVAKTIDDAVIQIMRSFFTNMDGAPEEEKIKSMMAKKEKAYEASKKKICRELEKNKKQLEVLQLEISKTLLGDSVYSTNDLKEAINTVRMRIADANKRLDNIDQEMSKQEKVRSNIMPAYRRFKDWAEVFDTASLEQKKMIASQLFESIEVGAGYNLTINVNAMYKDFCFDKSDKEGLEKVAG